jgi:ParB family chromosome partitioning protein
MKYKLDDIDLNDVDIKDEYYRITTRFDIDDILPSIRHLGILNPPFLNKNKSVFSIVSGFRRLSALRNTGGKKFKARIIDPDEDALKVACLAIADNSFSRELNLVEISNAFNLLAECMDLNCSVTDKRLPEFFASINLPDDPGLINKIRRISHLPETVRNRIAENHICLSMALELDRIDHDAASFFAGLFKSLKTGLNKQREILTTVLEIAFREDIKIMDVLNEREFREIINNPDVDTSQKTGQIRHYLKTRRFPEITRAEESFKHHLNALKLHSGIKLVPPKSFEGQTFLLNLSFETLEELTERRNRLNEIIKNPLMKHILDKQF